MVEYPLKTRKQFLLETQNRDGGWGYFPGKQSWLEPTVYAALALQGTPAAGRVRDLLNSWALADGGWRATAAIPDPCWAMSLAVTLCSVNRWDDPALYRGVSLLERTIGAEGSFIFQLNSRVHREITDLDFSLQGWPWRPGTTSWIEPTAHAIIALRNVTRFLGERQVPKYAGLMRRIEIAEQMLLGRRAADGGWNYGSRQAWGINLPSYPETTALALIGLRGNPTLDVTSSLEVAGRQFADTKSALARAWLTIALNLYAVPIRAVAPESRPSQDIMVAALQCLAFEDAGRAFFHRIDGVAQ